MRVVFFNLLGWLLLALQAAGAFFGHGLHCFHCDGHACSDRACSEDSCDRNRCSALSCLVRNSCAEGHSQPSGSCAKHAHQSRNECLHRKNTTTPLAFHEPLCSGVAAGRRTIESNEKPSHDANCAICHLLALGQLEPDRFSHEFSLSLSGHTPFPPESPVLADRYAVALPRSPPGNAP